MNLCFVAILAVIFLFVFCLIDRLYRISNNLVALQHFTEISPPPNGYHYATEAERRALPLTCMMWHRNKWRTTCRANVFPADRGILYVIPD